MENLPASLPLDLPSPWLNAAGMLGFTPPAQAWNWPRPQGAFITNPISLKARQPAGHRALIPFPGGVLLHSDLPNPGLRRVLREHASAWRRASLPVWPHLFGEPEEIAAMVRILEEVEGVAALEISIPLQAGREEAAALLRAARGELPLVACLPLQLAHAAWLAELGSAGASALHLDAPRGALPDARGSLVRGRLYGAGLLPQVLEGLQAAQKTGLPVLVGGGIENPADGELLLRAGALGVAVDVALWRASAGEG